MLTLAEAKIGMRDHIDIQVHDTFRRGSLLLDRLIFDNAASAGTGGSTLTYGYLQLLSPATASFRAINTEYTPVEAKRRELTAYCRVFGGKFGIDRVIADTSGAIDEMTFQMEQQIAGAINLFHYTTINGDRATNPLEYDGLDTILTGASTEFTPGEINLSTSALMSSNYLEFSDRLIEFMSLMDGRPTLLLMNSLLKAKIVAVAHRMGYFTQAESAFGVPVDMWDNIPLVDLENYFDPATQTTRPVVGIDAGLTDLYAVQIAQDGFHGISPTGSKIINTYFPDMNLPGAVKNGEVEMVAGVVLKNQLKAGVMRGIRVQ